MFRKALTLTAIVLVFSVCNLQAEQISCSWVGCEDGLWGDPSNWSCGMVPDNNETNTFVVTIDTSSCPNMVTISLQQDRTIDQLDCYGKLDIDLDHGTSSWWWVELTIHNGLTNHGELDIDDLDIRGNITNATGATLRLFEDKFIHDGNLYNQAGAMIEIADEVNFELGNIDNAGVIMLVPGSMLDAEHTLHNTGQINVYGGDCGGFEIFDNNSTGIIRGYGSLHGGTDSFRNKGQIIAFGGSLLVGSFAGPIINSGLLANKPSASLHITYVGAQGEDVNNNGTIEVHSGGGVTFDCNMVNEPNGIIKLLGGTLAATTITQTADATFEGQGDISTENLIIETDGLIRLTGPTNIFGSVQIDPNATLEIRDGQTLITGKITCNGTIRMIGGRVIPQGGLSGSCKIELEEGAYSSVADFNLDGQVNFIDFAYLANAWLWQASWY